MQKKVCVCVGGGGHAPGPPGIAGPGQFIMSKPLSDPHI